MTERPRAKPRLRHYLIAWFAASAVVMVVAYTQLLDYYLDLGIELTSQAILEREALDYAHRLANGESPELPAGANLAAYSRLADVPAPIRALFPAYELDHGEVETRLNLDFDDDDDLIPVATEGLCGDVDCEMLFFYPHQLSNGESLYLLHGMVGSEATYDELKFAEQVAFGIGGLITAVFLLILFLALRGIDRPLRRLDSWSASLGADDQTVPIPNLRFRELDALAKRLIYAFERLRDGVEKEKLFLRHASHELRTPIAILSTNVELLDRLTQRAARTEAETASLTRQYRALDDIGLLIETLLWVNRQSDQTPRSETIDLRVELDTVVDSYRYLLDAHAVDFSVIGDAATVNAPGAAVRIVLSNLVKNAFQHTVEGTVRIRVDQHRVEIENAFTTEANATSDGGTEQSFGLGLELVARICDRFEWQCATDEHPGRRTTTVVFSGAIR